MKKANCYEKYPFWIVLISNLVSIAIYAIGAYIIYQLGIIWLALYLIYILILEFRLMKKSCPNCYYYGKYCAFGRGKLSAIFFKRGDDPKRFSQHPLKWKDLFIDFMVSLIPIVVGVILLIIHFDILILLSIILLIVLSSVGNGFVRGSLACKYCKQRELGCPAEKLFKKNK